MKEANRQTDHHTIRIYIKTVRHEQTCKRRTESLQYSTTTTICEDDIISKTVKVKDGPKTNTNTCYIIIFSV